MLVATYKLVKKAFFKFKTVISFVAANLAILLAAKVGLFKICVGIALVIGSMKFLVILAWALAIFKYVPDPYIYNKSHDYQKAPLQLDRNPFDHDHYGHDRYGHERYGHIGPHRNEFGQGPYYFGLLNSMLKLFKLQ